MARKLRNIAQGNTHYCFSHCHGKRDLLKSRWCSRYMVQAIQKCQEKYNFELIAAEPVGNQINIIIRTLEDQETVSRIMQYIKARIAEMYNRSTEQSGAFWNERFYSIVIEEQDNPEQYLLELLWKIGYKPVLKGLSRDPRKNYIGFINSYLIKDYKALVDITLHYYFTSLGYNFEECVEKFLLFEQACIRQL